MMRAPFANLPSFDRLNARCTECRALQQRKEPATPTGPQVSFPARCFWCHQPTETELTALVPVAVTIIAGQWRVTVLKERAIRDAREASRLIVSARCSICKAPAEGYETDFDGRCSETHLPAWCAHCGAPTEVLALEAASVSLGHEKDEWYVCVLEGDEVDLLRLGIDPLDEHPC